MKLNSREASVAAMNRGSAYRAKHDSERALHDYEEAITLDPKNAGAYVNRAFLLWRKGKHSESFEDLNRAIRINPNQWEAYYERAANYRDEHRLDEALVDLDKVIQLHPDVVGAYTNRAAIYLQKDEIDKALTDCNKAIQIDPNSGAAYISRAKVYVHNKQFNEAGHDLEQISQLNLKRPESTLNSLAWFLATSPEPRIRNGKKAIEAATKACELMHWKNWRHIDTLAAAYAETEDFDSAIKYGMQALQTAPNDDDVEGAKQRLQLYRQHKAYREKPKQ